MNIYEARHSEVPEIVSVLQEAAQWLVDGGRALWSPVDIDGERVLRDVNARLFYIAREDRQLAGVMKFELEDPYFWPEVTVGTSAFVHKLAVRRAWAKKGISTNMLSFARTRAQTLGCQTLRLDCVADRVGLRCLYENFGFSLHSVIQKGGKTFARYQISTKI